MQNRSETGVFGVSDTISAKYGRNFDLCVHYTCGRETAPPQASDLPGKTRTRSYPDFVISSKLHVYNTHNSDFLPFSGEIVSECRETASIHALCPKTGSARHRPPAISHLPHPHPRLPQLPGKLWTRPAAWHLTHLLHGANIPLRGFYAALFCVLKPSR